MRCRWCVYWPRCKSLIYTLTGDETKCDWFPSKYRVRDYPYSRKMTEAEIQAEPEQEADHE